MKPTDILLAEHRVIEQVLDCVEVLAHKAHAEGLVAVEDARVALNVLTTFADRCHHGKEEHELFPAMEQRGMPRHVGPLAVMLAEHELGRAAIKDMQRAVEDAGKDPAGAAQRFHRAAESYVELLRDHIAKEDSVVFPMAESMFRDADRELLLKRFAQVEHADLGAGVHEQMIGLADGLAERYGVTKAAQRTSAAGHGCCGHQGGCHS